MSRPPSDLSGKGMLYVNSYISDSILDETTFLKWYDEDHIPEILEVNGFKSAVRWIDEPAKKEEGGRPYLSLYPMEDLGVLNTPEFAAISVKSDMLPGSQLIYDMADFDVRYLQLVQVFDPKNKGKGHTKTIIAAHFALKDDAPDGDFDRWYREEHLNGLAKVDGYVRSTRYKLIWGRSNATSRNFKGVAGDSAPPPEPLALPEWLSLHEFGSEEVDIPGMKKHTDTEWTRKVFGYTKEYRHAVFKIAKEHGTGEIFNGVSV